MLVISQRQLWCKSQIGSLEFNEVAFLHQLTCGACTILELTTKSDEVGPRAIAGLHKEDTPSG